MNTPASNKNIIDSTSPDTDTCSWVTRASLMIRIRSRHDTGSWDEFIRYYKQYVYNVIRSIGLNAHDAAEVHQVVMIKLWKIIPELDEGCIHGRFRNWLFSVVKNQVREYIREHSRRTQRENAVIEERDYLNSITMPETDELAEKEWQDHLIQLCWQQIEQEFSAKDVALVRSVISGTPVAQLAKEYGLAESSVYVYKKRVADRMRQIYEELSDFL